MTSEFRWFRWCHNGLQCDEHFIKVKDILNFKTFSAWLHFHFTSKTKRNTKTRKKPKYCIQNSFVVFLSNWKWLNVLYINYSLDLINQPKLYKNWMLTLQHFDRREYHICHTWNNVSKWTRLLDDDISCSFSISFCCVRSNYFQISHLYTILANVSNWRHSIQTSLE